MLHHEKYIKYSERDFISDPLFQDWILNPDAEKEIFWNEFLEKYPEKKDAVENAYSFIKNLSFKEDIPDELLLQQSLAQHLEAIKGIQKAQVIKLNRFNRFRNVLKIAAVFGGVVLLATALYIFNKRDKKLVVQTGYGKIDSVLLPDNSLAVLNGHSKIEYNKNWKSDDKREVWLDGEAFFEVRHLNNDPKHIKPSEQFLLHTKNLTIEVLGTSFNVRQRRGKTEVVLQTGKIKIVFDDGQHEALLMAPGDIVAYDPKENEFTKTTTIPENYTAWKERKLILNNATVENIIEYLEDNFGKKIILQTPQVATVKIEGPIMLNNLNDALFILSTILSSDITENNNTIIIRPR